MEQWHFRVFSARRPHLSEMNSRPRLELVAWATTHTSTWEGFWYSRLGETHLLGQEYHISSTIQVGQHRDSSRAMHSICSYHFKHHIITIKHETKLKNKQDTLKVWNPSFLYLEKLLWGVLVRVEKHHSS